MSRIEIILIEPYRGEALRSLQQQGKQVMRSEFRGPIFEDGAAKIGPGHVEVRVDGAQYVYPLHTVARVKITKSEGAE